MSAPTNYLQLVDRFKSAPAGIQEYFPDFVSLVEGYSWDVSVAYFFSLVESIKHRTIYSGIVRLHGTDATITGNAVDNHYMSRTDFWKLIVIVFGTTPPAALKAKLEKAEKIRDKIAHGKNRTDREIRESLSLAIEFCEEFNEFIYSQAGFRPIGDLRGFKGRQAALSKATTRWVLKGMGFSV